MKTKLQPFIGTRDDIVEQTVDYLLDMCGKPHGKKKKIKEGFDDTDTFSLSGRPYDHPRQIRIKPIIDVDIITDESSLEECGEVPAGYMAGDEESFEGAQPSGEYEEEPAKETDPQKLQNKINTVPNQNAPALLASVRDELRESSEAYKKYFQSMLAKWGVKSPAELSDEKKKAFFNAVDKGWKGEKE